MLETVGGGGGGGEEVWREAQDVEGEGKSKNFHSVFLC